MLNSFTQYRSQVPGFGAIDYFFSSVVGQRKGPSGANAPPVYGIKKCLGCGPVVMLPLSSAEDYMKFLMREK
jgi:hypothetical protein